MADWESIDLILGIEAMGLPLTSPLSMRNERPQVVVRKRSYGLEGEVAIDQSTGYSKGSMFLNDIQKGERVLIVDDVLSLEVRSMQFFRALRRLVQSSRKSLSSSKRAWSQTTARKIPSHQDIILVRLEMDGGKVVLLDEVI